MAELLEEFFASRTRARLIAAFAMRPGEQFYLREVSRLIQADVRAVKVELDRLERLGFLKSQISGNRRYLEVNQTFPLYPELKTMALKTLGLGDVLREALAQTPGLQFAFIYGSVAKGEEKPDSDLDLFVIGEASGREFHRALSKAEDVLRREVNIACYPLDELKKRLKREGKGTFLKDVFEGPKIFIIGTEDELAGALGVPKA